jgi:TetR/AcrR family transcriptional regulator, transcriptional repressor for nem operon
MRITRKQSEENRARVIDGAAKLFREKGFDGVGVADLMLAAGMTHGGFYNHFASKDELEADACRQALKEAVEKIGAIARKADAGERSAAMAAYMRRYVSRKARDAAVPSCPMAAFAGEMPRQSAQVAAAYAAGLRDYLDAFTRASASASGDALIAKVTRQQALVQFSMLAGALILARSVAKADPALSDEFLGAANASLDRSGDEPQ